MNGYPHNLEIDMVCDMEKNAFFFETVDHWTKWAMASIAMLSYQRVSGAKTTQTSFN